MTRVRPLPARFLAAVRGWIFRGDAASGAQVTPAGAFRPGRAADDGTAEAARPEADGARDRGSCTARFPYSG